jgi:glycerate 2-kinase
MKRIEQARRELLQIFNAGLAEVDGRTVVARHLAQNPLQHECSLVALGKAAGAMAQGALDLLGDSVLDGLVISKPGHLDRPLLEARGLKVMEGSHPVPDADSLNAGTALIDFLSQLPADRAILFLISGGTSSLVEVLHAGIELDDLRRVNQWLLGSGFSIEKMNRVRKSMSAIKGGGLLRYIGERNVTGLFISDVRWDDPAVIGSGLLVAEQGDHEAVGSMKLPDWISRLTLPGEKDQPPASPHINLHIVASLQDAREAAAEAARALGYKTQVSHAFINAAAENVGRRLALELTDCIPGVYIWGGEPSVLLPDDPGRGGRNQHLALSAACVIEGTDDILFLSAGTDGSDGPGEDAGALVDGGTLGRAKRQGFDPDRSLASADSGSLLAASGDLIRTGPTGTNVMDLMIGMRIEKQQKHEY